MIIFYDAIFRLYVKAPGDDPCAVIKHFPF